MTPRLSIIVPTLDAAASLGATLEALTRGDSASAFERIVVDGGSRDDTVAIARAHGARVIESAAGRGIQLAVGGAATESEWLLFLHADTRLAAGWPEAVRRFVADAGNRERVAAFRFALDDDSAAARRVERLVAWRCRVLRLPYGDQGLLIRRSLYIRLGGFRPLPLMEDVEFVRRIGRARIRMLDVAAVTSAARYRRGGWLLRPARNLLCLTLYFLGLPPRLIRLLYA
jgi:rSAM/selenodomain-associated transferase 2